MKQEQNLRYYLEIVWRRKYYFLAPFILICLVTAVVAVKLPSIYESAATVLIEEQQIPEEFVRTTVTGYAEQRIQSITQQILSRTRLWEIIQRFDLYPERQQNSTQDEIIETMRKNINLDTISAEMEGRRRGPQATIAFTVAYRGKEPETVQNVAGTLASLYLEENLKIRGERARSTTMFLETELQGIQERIHTLGEQITAFKKQHGEILPELQQFNLSQVERLENEIKQLEIQIRAAEDRRGYLQGQLASAQQFPLAHGGERVMGPATRLLMLRVAMADLQSKFSDDHPDVRKVRREIAELEKMTGKISLNPSVKSERLFQLQADLAEIQSRYSDQHPEVIKLRKEIETLAQEPESLASLDTVAEYQSPAYVNLQANIQDAVNEINSMRSQRQHLAEKLQVYRERIRLGPTVEQEYLALMRNYENAHKKHQEVMDKIMEARIAEGMEEHQKAEKFTLIDPASYPQKPVSPHRLLILFAGLFLGFGAGLGTVALAEHLDQSLKKPEEFAKLTGLPILGKIALIQTEEDLFKSSLKWKLIVAVVVLTLATGLVMFHLFYMDLWILAANFWRLMGKLA
jgi:polysaccharide biosynthesis transport protein